MNLREENLNPFKFTGIISRSGFIVNFMYITILGNVLTLPLLASVICNGSIFSGNITDVFASSALIPILLYLILLPLSFYMNFANFAKRYADIVGEENTPLKYLFIFIALLILHSAITYEAMSLGSYFMPYTQLALLIIFASFKGKFTGENYNPDMAKFNWGAFWGTWIWGLMNKVSIRKTIWALPAFFVFALPYFAVICGIKGNRWAYEAQEWTDMNEFHESQARQGIVWSLLIPILSLILLAGAFVIFSSLFSSYFENTILHTAG